jgi:hypothetical protein
MEKYFGFGAAKNSGSTALSSTAPLVQAWRWFMVVPYFSQSVHVTLTILSSYFVIVNRPVISHGKFAVSRYLLLFVFVVEKCKNVD